MTVTYTLVKHLQVRPTEWSPIRGSTLRVGSLQTRVEVTVNDKHSSLLLCGINYGYNTELITAINSFMKKTPSVYVMKPFFIGIMMGINKLEFLSLVIFLVYTVAYQCGVPRSVPYNCLQTIGNQTILICYNVSDEEKKVL